MSIKLDKRLSSILNEIEGDVFADIGCDHGKLSVKALLNGKCTRVIAVDISKNSLDKTILLAKKFGISNKIDCRLGNGFQVITENIDTAVIAGLGGCEIKDILLGNIPCIKKLILCPHQNVKIARETLNTVGYSAIKDYVIKEHNKFYQIIVAKRGEKQYSDKELRFGLNQPQNDNYVEMLQTRKLILEERFAGQDIPQGEMLSEYEEIIRCLK